MKKYIIGIILILVMIIGVTGCSSGSSKNHEEIDKKKIEDGVSVTFKDENDKIIISNEDIRDISLIHNHDDSYHVTFNLKKKGRTKFAKATEANIGKSIYIFLNDLMVSCPIINQKIDSDNFIFATGDKSKKEMERVFNGLTTKDLDETQSTQNSKYYPVVIEQPDGLVFNMTMNMFINNYNSNNSIVVDEYALSPSDFTNIGSGNGWFSNIKTDRYMSSNTFFKSNKAKMCIQVDENGNITSISIMLDPELVSTDVVIPQYSCILKAINPALTKDDIASLLQQMQSNSEKSRTKATYSKGLALYWKHQTEAVVVLGVDAATEEQWRTTTGLE